MESKRARLMFLGTLILFLQIFSPASAWNVGVCYGRNGDNLPSPADTVALYKRINVAFIRMYEPFADMLEALRGSGLLVALGPRNEDLKTLSENLLIATVWVNTWVVPYMKDVSIKWITMGNEVIPGELAGFVAGAMRNINTALQAAGATGISVTTVLSENALANSYPPSAGAFVPDVTQIMTDIASVLSSTNSPLMINTYPYFAYSSNPGNISSEYALFTSTTPAVIDGDLQYFNLFEAMVDGFNAALEKINYGTVRLAVAESGWPTAGNSPYTSTDNALAYNKGLLNYATTKGTPRRPQNQMDTFFFEMFNEDLKQGGVEQSFGFFTPAMAPVYPFWESQ